MGQSEGVADVRVVLAVDEQSARAPRLPCRRIVRVRADRARVGGPGGLLHQIVAGVERVGADAVVVGFDDAAASIRRETWPQYKEHRSEKSQCLSRPRLLALAAEVLRAMGVAVVIPPEGLEADDVLASTAAHAPAAGATTVIMTSDRDAFALIDATPGCCGSSTAGWTRPRC